MTISDLDGPLGTWWLGGEVAVGEEGDSAFPVPTNWRPGKCGSSQPWRLPAGCPQWRALGKIDAYYSVYVKLLDAGGNAVAGWDGQPHDGQAPTLLWVPGEQ